jgi:hypothetical protein
VAIVHNEAQQRRRRLLRAIAAALSGAAAPCGFAQVLAQATKRLPPGKSVYDSRGSVQVNGRPLSAQAQLGAGDEIVTARRSHLVFAVGDSAFLVREQTRVSVGGGAGALALRVATGAILSVFGTGAQSITTPTAVIGIRGTGIYVEAQPDRSYVCVCYGSVDVTPAGAPAQVQNLVSKHHDAPMYVLGAGAKRVRPASVVNHTDQELTLLEALVGRTPPFGTSGY